MDPSSKTFLTGVLNEEACVEKPKGFVDSPKPDHVYKLEKALYGLKQAPRAWYQRLTDFLLEINFLRGEADIIFFVKRTKGHVIIVQIYVDDLCLDVLVILFLRALLILWLLLSK